LVGWSIGSAVALSVAKNYPDLVSKQVLVTPFAWTVNSEYKEKPWFKIVVGLVRVRERLFPIYNPKSKYKFLRESESLNDEYSDWAWSNLNRSKDAFIYQDGSRYVVPFDARPWAHEIRIETLAVIGGNDKLVPENVASELTDLLPNVRIKKINGATHAVPWSHAEELSSEIFNFLEN
jgi:pimeloyl-ACP methyl ester carboxylesterase